MVGVDVDVDVVGAEVEVSAGSVASGSDGSAGWAESTGSLVGVSGSAASFGRSVPADRDSRSILAGWFVVTSGDGSSSVHAPVKTIS